MWFRDNPDLLQRELDALEEAGLSYTLDTALQDTDDLIQISVQVPVDDETHTFVATYPDDFPYFKPFVTGPDLGYRHHVSPTTWEYCLLETGKGAWSVDDTLAWLLTTQMDKVVTANTNPSAALDTPGLEVAQAEPFTAYLPYKNLGEILIVDSTLSRGTLRSGIANLVYTSGAGDSPLRGHVCALRDPAGAQLGEQVEPPTRADPRLGEVQIVWVQLEGEPRTNSPRDWWEAAAKVTDMVERGRQGVPGRAQFNNAQAVQIVLVGFSEETGHRSVGQGWTALVRERAKANKTWSAPRFVRVERAGHADLYDREPRLRAMQHARIAVIGLGGLGSHLVPLLGCMAPAKMWFIDADHTSAATAIRNPGAFATNGTSKAELALRVVHATQPYTQPHAVGMRIGAPREPRATAPRVATQPASLADMFKNVDLVIDATADLSVQHFLSDKARNHNVAYLRAEALPGVRSGFVALQRPDADVCWMCWQHHLASTIAPLPAHEPAGGVQPPGCPDPTYTGAGVDLAAIAAQTAQVAASYLTGADGYGHLPADVMTVHFVDDTGNPIPPRWASHALTRHPDCPNHRA